MRSLTTLVAFLGACANQPPPDALITCHNGNCAHSDPKRDDTMEALHESLALEIDGRAVIDGIEIDLIWDPRTSRCVYEHDHIDADFAPETTVPVAAVAAHLRERRSAAAWNGETFVVKFELKPGAAPDQRDLSPAEMEALADCALARSDELQAAADDAGLALTVIYESENEVQLRALPERPAWCAERAGRHAARQLAVTQWRTARGMSDAVGVVTMYWKDARDGDYTRYQDLEAAGVDLMMWGFDASEEALAAYEYVVPTYINTNEAPLLRRWVTSGARR